MQLISIQNLQLDRIGIHDAGSKPSAHHFLVDKIDNRDSIRAPSTEHDQPFQLVARSHAFYLQIISLFLAPVRIVMLFSKLGGSSVGVCHEHGLDRIVECFYVLDDTDIALLIAKFKPEVVFCLDIFPNSVLAVASVNPDHTHQILHYRPLVLAGDVELIVRLGIWRHLGRISRFENPIQREPRNPAGSLASVILESAAERACSIGLEMRVTER